MAFAPTNLSYDGSPVQFRLESPLVAGFDPLALDMLGELLPADVPLDIPGLLERANANYPALACFTIPDFRSGLYTLDPHDIKKFGDEDDEFDYGDDEIKAKPADNSPSYRFAAVDSGALVFADLGQLPHIVRLFTWEQYNLSLTSQGDAVIAKIVEALGEPYFALVHGGCMPGMEFDGDGTYTIPAGRLKRVHG
jgi:hypothetical protein